MKDQQKLIKIKQIILENYCTACNLNKDTVSMEDSILESGLDSIGMITIISQVQFALDCSLEINIVELFLSGSINDLAQKIFIMIEAQPGV